MLRGRSAEEADVCLRDGQVLGNKEVVEARFVDLAPHSASIQFLSEDPQFAGTMTITWRLEPPSNGTLVGIVADDVPSASATPRTGRHRSISVRNGDLGA
jgi:hypothetical protein